MYRLGDMPVGSVFEPVGGREHPVSEYIQKHFPDELRKLLALPESFKQLTSEQEIQFSVEMQLGEHETRLAKLEGGFADKQREEIKALIARLRKTENARDWFDDELIRRELTLMQTQTQDLLKQVVELTAKLATRALVLLSKGAHDEH